MSRRRKNESLINAMDDPETVPERSGTGTGTGTGPRTGPDTGRGYNKQMVKKLCAIRDRAWSYTWLHLENARYLKDWYDRISYLNIFLELLTATSIFVTASFCQNVYYIRVLTGILSIISGFISALLKHEDYGQEIMRHKNAASKYSRIYDTIENQLSTPFSAQQQAHHFHNWISHEFDTLFNTAPDIDDQVKVDYTIKFGARRSVHPIEAAEFEKDLETGSAREVGGTSTERAGDAVSEAEGGTHSARAEGGTHSASAEGAAEGASEEKIVTKPSEAEKELRDYMKSIRAASGEKFTPVLYNYQMDRMSMNTDKCYIDRFNFERPPSTT